MNQPRYQIRGRARSQAATPRTPGMCRRLGLPAGLTDRLALPTTQTQAKPLQQPPFPPHLSLWR